MAHQMRTQFKRHWKFAFFLLVPMVLYAYVVERHSWQPKTLTAGGGYRILQLAFSPDGRTLAAACREDVAPEKLVFWDVRSRDLLKNVPTPDSNDTLYAIAFAPEGRTLATVWDKDTIGDLGYDTFHYGGSKVRFFDMKIGQWRRSVLLRRMEFDYTHGSAVTCFWPNRDCIAYHGWKKGSHHFFKFNLSTGKHEEMKVCQDDMGSSETTNFVFSPDGTTLAYTTAEHMPVLDMKLCDLRTPSVARVLARDDPVAKYGESVIDQADGYVSRGEEFNNLVFSPDGALLACAATFHYCALSNSSERIKIWNIRTGKLLQTLAVATARPFVIVFSPDGSLLACDDGKSVKLWDMSTGKVQRILHGHERAITAIAFSSDGRTLASGTNSGIIKLWRIK
jgi:WD40 repeat protein